jgi:hypothetical protein
VTDYVLLDAYGRFDRTGEGVMFEIRRDEFGQFTAIPDKDAKAYLKGLRADWNDDMREYAESYDVFTCPECGGDIVLDEDMVS